VVSDIDEVIFRTDAAGNWTFLNAAWTEITGFSIEEAQGRSLLEFVHADDRAAAEEHCRPLVDGGADLCRRRFAI
jgi:PAS domain S-box-containing protein